MSDKSLRYAKLMKAMGLGQEPAVPARPTPQAEPISPSILEALSGQEHPELAKKRQMLQRIDDNIAQLEESDDPNALESLNFWKRKRSELAGD